MASSVTLKVYGGIKGVFPTLRRYNFRGSATLAAGTYTTNGIPFTFNFQDANGNSFTHTRASFPDTCIFYTIAGSNLTYLWDQVNQTLRILAAGVELANGAAINTTDLIEFIVMFQKVDPPA